MQKSHRYAFFNTTINIVKNRMMTTKKYILTNETIKHDRRILHRIQRVSDGELGGFIESEKNLSHEGDCWVGDNAWVYENAHVHENAWVYENARVYGNAKVYGGTEVFENAQIFGYAHVYDNAKVHGNAQICGSAWVFGYAWVYENTKVRRDAMIYGRIELAIKNGPDIEDSNKLIQVEIEGYTITAYESYIMLSKRRECLSDIDPKDAPYSVRRIYDTVKSVSNPSSQEYNKKEDRFISIINEL